MTEIYGGVLLRITGAIMECLGECDKRLQDLRTPNAYDQQMAETQAALDQWEAYQRGLQEAFSSNDEAHLKMQLMCRQRGNETKAEQEMNKAWMEWKIRDAMIPS
jgi:hypothetical protein